MKKITLLSIILLLSYVGQSQNTRLEGLLSRYENIPPNPYSMSHYFNNEEITILNDHFTQQNPVIEESLARGASIATIFGANPNVGYFTSFTTDTPFDLLTLINDSLDGASVGFENGGDIDPSDPALRTAYVLTEIGLFYELDIITGVYTFLGIIAPPEDEDWTGLEFDTSTNILYAISGSFNFEEDMEVENTSTFSIINIDDLSFTRIGEMGLESPISVVTDGEGSWYVHDIGEDALFSLDPITAETTLIGSVGFDASFSQDMEWDSANGILYMTAFNFSANRAELRIVDTTTGDTSLVGRIGMDPNSQAAWGSIRNPSTAVLSVSDNEVSQISIFPNPTQDTLNISSGTPIEQIKIYNSLGQNIITLTVNNQLQYSISTIDIPNGLYVIELTTPSGILTEKFIKQ